MARENRGLLMTTFLVAASVTVAAVVYRAHDRETHVSPSDLLSENAKRQAARIAGAMMPTPGPRSQGTQSGGAGASAGPGSSAAQSGDSLSEEWKKATAQLKYLEACYASQICPFPQTNPVIYSETVEDKLVEALGAFTAVAKSWSEKTGALPDEAQQVARHFLAFPNDDVKEAALQLIGLSPASEENMRAVIGSLEQSVSAPLYRTGLNELARYAKAGEPAALDAFLLTTLRQGGYFASSEVARASLEFMTPENAGMYASVLRELPPRSKSHHYLKLNLEEFARMQRGG